MVKVNIDFYVKERGFMSGNFSIPTEIAQMLRGKPHGKTWAEIRDARYWEAIQYLKSKIASALGIAGWDRQIIRDQWREELGLATGEPVQIISIKKVGDMVPLK